MGPCVFKWMSGGVFETVFSNHKCYKVGPYDRYKWEGHGAPYKWPKING